MRRGVSPPASSKGECRATTALSSTGEGSALSSPFRFSDSICGSKLLQIGLDLSYLFFQTSNLLALDLDHLRKFLDGMHRLLDPGAGFINIEAVNLSASLLGVLILG